MIYKTAYALITRHCNLACTYCDVKNDKPDGYDRDAFMSQLRNFDGSIILFGGEPTLYRDRLKDVVYSDPVIRKKINSITTNLMIADDEIINILNDIGNIATSWNPSRFTRPGEYQTWEDNLNKINGRIKLRVLVTMSYELLDMDPKDVIATIQRWNFNTISDIFFENLIDDSVTPEYFERADKFISSIHDLWHTVTEYRGWLPALTNDKDIYGRHFDCNNKYTINPDGSIHKGCSHAATPTICEDCYSCELVDKCMPCALQKYCSFPKQFHQKLLDEQS